ncbi:MAG TPA: hypothetical protein VGW34_01110 [Allosphingosinicella sp.]|nr:hypothetical protein [Allosphingosinicella sp.]
MTLAQEARLQLIGSGLMWLLAAASLPTIAIANGLFLTIGFDSAVPWDRYAIVAGYDAALILALRFFFKSGRAKAAKIVLALLLAPLAVIGAITIEEQLSAEASTQIIR